MDDVLLAKKVSLERCVRQIRLYRSQSGDVPFAEDFLRQDAIAINLQRIAELCIDMANRLVRKHRLGVPRDSRESFTLLEEARIIPPAMAQNLRHMVGFRNLLVHEYREVELGIMEDVIANHLDEVIEYSALLLRHEAGQQP